MPGTPEDPSVDLFNFYLSQAEYQLLFIKLWTLALKLEYTTAELSLHIDKTQLPLKTEVYLELRKILIQALQPYKRTEFKTKLVEAIIGQEYVKVKNGKVTFYEQFAIEVLEIYGVEKLREYT